MTVLTARISNFKSINTVDLPLELGLNVLIGPNGAGKTCLLASLKFLKDLLTAGTARAVARAGGPKAVMRRGSDNFGMNIKISYGQRIFRRRPRSSIAEWNLVVRLSDPDGIPFLAKESIHARLDDSGELLFRVDKKLTSAGDAPRITATLAPAVEFGRDVLSFFQDPSGRINKQAIARSFQDFHKRMQQEGEANPDASLLPMCAILDSSLSELLARFLALHQYNISPDTARRPTEPQSLPTMGADGEGVAEVIHALETTAFHRLEMVGRLPVWDYDYSTRYWPRHYLQRSFYRPVFYTDRRPKGSEHPYQTALENILRELRSGVRPIDGITTQIDPTTGRRSVVFLARDQRFYPEEVSDGTIKWLCLLVSIYVSSSRIYLLEEPENFLHPWMQQRLISTMREQAELTKTIFVLTTHSSTILNATRLEEVFVVTPGEKGTRVQRIADPDEVANILTDSAFGLGDLWVSGAISGVPGSDD